jgi:transcriptional regulator with XRE-family HTH domain
MLSALCDRIKELRLRRNLTQKRMGKILGITERAYANIENNRADVGIKKLLLICVELKIPLHDLLNLNKSIDEILKESS